MKRCRLGITTVLLVITLMAVNSMAIEISFSPQNPKAGDSVKFFVNVTEEVESIKLWIEECKGNQCFMPKTIEMNEIEPGHFMAEYQLRDDTTSVHYKVKVTFQNGSHMETELQEFNVASGASGNQEKKKSPGYEIALALISVILVVIAYRRLTR